MPQSLGLGGLYLKSISLPHSFLSPLFSLLSFFQGLSWGGSLTRSSLVFSNMLVSALSSWWGCKCFVIMVLRNPETGIQYFSTQVGFWIGLKWIPKTLIYHRILRCRTELMTQHVFIPLSSEKSLSWSGWQRNQICPADGKYPEGAMTRTGT